MSVERHWRSVLELIDEIVFVVRVSPGDASTGQVKYVSPAIERMLGYRADEFLADGNLWSQCIHPDDLAAVTASTATILNGGRPGVRRYRFRSRDGSAYRWLEDRVIPDIAADGRVTQFIGVARDITERRGEQRVRDVLEAAPDAMLLAREDGSISFANGHCERLFGYDAGELVGQPVEILVPGPLRQRHAAHRAAYVTRRYNRQMGSGLNLLAVRKDGAEFRAEISLGPVESDHGPLISVCIRDITERSRTEDALRHSEVAYRELVTHATYGIYRSTPEGRFLSVNPALVSMLGYESTEALLAADIGTDIYVDPAERERLIARYGQGDEIRKTELQWRRRDGTQITVSLTGRAVHNAAGRLECFEIFVQDVSEQRALENQLRQSQKMEAVGQLTAGIAHDFNNILTTVLVSAELVADRIPGEDASARADLHDIQVAGRRGAEMIRKLMAFSRSGRLDFRPLDLNEVLAETTAMLRRVLPENISIRIAAEPVGTVRADRTAIEQILLNLATNARDAMPEGGLLRLELTPRTIDRDFKAVHGFGEPGRYVRIAVTDDGTGMDEPTKARVFEPFFTTKPPGQGTGLGLAMVYGLVKQHAGFVTIYSEGHVGTTIAVYFPLAPASAERVEDRLPPPRGGTEKVLLVEDEETIREAVPRLLEHYGYTVITASDGQEALELLQDRASAFDLVITDVVMPRLSGRRLHKAAMALGVRARFLFTSGYPRRDVRDTAELDPRLPFLQKPWTTAELVVAVRKVLDAPPEG